MRSATADSKTPYDCARTSTPKAAWSHNALQCGKKKRQTDRSCTRRTDEVPFIVACSHFTRKNTRFRAPASSPKQSPCNIHATIAMRFAAWRRKPAPIYTHNNTRWQQSCSHSNAICNHRFQNTLWLRKQAHPKQLEATVTVRQGKKGRPTAAAPAAQTRYLSSSAAATLHRKTQGFVLRLPPQNKANATFMQPFHCSLPPQIQETHRTTHTASRTTSPLPVITTSLRHHFPLPPLPCITTSLRHHFPSSPLPFLTTSHRHHLPSSPPCVIASYSMWCTILFWCIVMKCKVSHHPSSKTILFWCIVV